MEKNHVLAQVENFLILNCALYSKEQLYAEARKRFNVSAKQVSAIYLRLQKRGDVLPPNLDPVNPNDKQLKKYIKQEGENLTISLDIDYEIRTLEDLLRACEVDTEKWEVISWQCKKWDLGIKNAEDRIETKQLFSVNAKFRPKKVDSDVVLQKQVILDELFEKAPLPQLPLILNPNSEAKYLLELALFDVHFGKLAHREESGEDYDIQIAVKRYNDALLDLIGRVDFTKVERILLPIGNDMINVDNKQGTTTSGTPQDTDSRFYKIVRTVKNLLITVISDLSNFAPIDVVVVAGNHDEQTSFMVGEMLEAYFHKSERVTVHNEACLRKYYQYGKVGLMFTHGDKEKHPALGMIFAAENPKLWAATTQRYIQLGHYHHNKKINYLSNEEFQGFQIQIIPSLSGSDAWHQGKGFKSLKQAKAFLYEKQRGLVGEFTHTVV